MAGTVGFEQGHRGPSPSVICQTPPLAEARRWNPEARGPNAQFGVLGELSAARQALEGGNVAPRTLATFEGTDKPSPTPTSGQTRIESRDFAI